MEDRETIGQKFSPILVEIEAALLEHAACVEKPTEFTDDGFRAALQIFWTAILDKMYALQVNEGFMLGTACDMAEKCGNDLRAFVKTYTNIDTTTLYSCESTSSSPIKK